MTEIRIEIYHRVDDDVLFQFSASKAPALKHVFTYSDEVELEALIPIMTESMEEFECNPAPTIVERAFEKCNHGSGKEIIPRNMRSLCVGDVVLVGETAWECLSLGWRSLSTGELSDALHERGRLTAAEEVSLAKRIEEVS